MDKINLKELFLSKIKEIEEELSKNKYDFFIKKHETRILNGGSFTAWVLNFILNGNKKYPFSYLEFVDNPFNVQDRYANDEYIKFRTIHRDKNKLINLIKSPLELYFDNQSSLNCNHIGFIPANKKIFYNDIFLNFLENKIILNTNNYYTLLNTLESYYLTKEFPFLSFNKEECLSKLNLSVFLSSRQNNIWEGIPINELQDKMSIEPNPLYYPSKYKNLLNELDHNLIKNNKFFINLENPHPLIKYSRQLENLVFDKNKDFNSLLSFLLTGSDSRIKKKTILFLSNVLDIKDIDFDKYPELLNDFNEEKALSLRGFINEHFRLRQVSKSLLKSGWSVQNIILFLLRLKKERPSVIGYFENYPFSNVSKLSTPEQINTFFDSITDIYWKERRKKEKILVSALDISNFTFKDNVKELISTVDLEIEGEEMNHCVGGYSRVIGNNHRIFHIKTENNDSTAEIKSNYPNGTWKCVQHRAKHNGRTSQENNKVVEELLNFINVKKETPNTSDFNFNEILSQKEIFKSTKSKSDEYKTEMFNFIKQQNIKSITELTLKLINNQHLRKFISLSKDLNKIPKDSFVNPKTKDLTDFIYQTAVEEKSFIVQINRSNFSKKDEYKQLGFVWSPTKKRWWTASKIKELEELNEYFNNIEILPSSTKHSQELIKSTQSFVDRNPNGLNKNQKARIQGLLK